MLLKSLLLNSTRPFMDAENEQGASDNKQQQRDNIKVDVMKEEENKKEGEKKDDANDNVDENNKGEEGNKEDESEENNEENEEESNDDNEEENKEVELTEEQKTIKKLEAKIARLERRVGKTAGERDNIKKELSEAKKALEAKIADGEQPLTEEEVNRRARELAQQELTQKEFKDAETKLIKDATAIDKNFMTKVQEMAEEVAPIPPFFIGALGDLDNGGAVLNYLADNPDEYEELLKRNNPTKIIKGLVDVSNKLIEAAKPKPKKISEAPKPPGNFKGNNTSPTVLRDNMSMDEWVRTRNKQAEENRKRKLGLM